jgi:hypothetical protein
VRSERSVSPRSSQSGHDHGDPTTDRDLDCRLYDPPRAAVHVNLRGWHSRVHASAKARGRRQQYARLRQQPSVAIDGSSSRDSDRREGVTVLCVTNGCGCAALPASMPADYLTDVSVVAGNVESVIEEPGKMVWVWRCLVCGQLWTESPIGRGLYKIDKVSDAPKL